jgi:L-2-hydroxyglutarate oxidase
LCRWQFQGPLSRLEPNVTGAGAPLVFSTGIVNNNMIAAALPQIVMAMGGDLRLGAEIISIRERSDADGIPTSHQRWSAKTLIVCAGLQSDRLAKLALQLHIL